MRRVLEMLKKTREPVADDRPVLSVGVIVLFLAGVTLEIAASLICHMIPVQTSLDECLSLLAIFQIIVASIVVHRRLSPAGLILIIPVLAGLFFIFSKSLDVAGSIPSLDGIYLIGSRFPMHKVVKDFSFFVGSMLLLLSFFLAALEARVAQRDLAKQHSALLREMEERRRLATAIEQSGEAIVITDASGIIQYVNPAFVSMTGYARDEAIGQNSNILKSGKHDSVFYRRLWDTLARDGAWNGHFVNQRKDGSLFEEDCTISSVHDESGTLTNYIALKHDVTARVTIERQLRHAQKMETVGSLANRIAHDFNNILALILGHGEMALRRLDNENPVRMNLEHIVKAGNRGANMVKQILTFSRQVEQERHPVDVFAVVNEALDFLRATLPTTIILRENVRYCGMILADPTQLHQVVINLCTNAFQAIGTASGAVEVRLDEKDLDVGFVADAGTPSPGAYVRLSVRDTGCGIDSATIPHIFDPFFSTKKPGEGTGLGLASVHGIVTGHGGAITVNSEVGLGTTIDVFFPQMEPAPVSMAVAARPLATGSERILFVDDDVDCTVLYREALERLGYVVTTCSNSLDALRLVQEQPDAFDLIITDHVMPDLTGAELAREILAIRPRCPVIIVTGFSQGISRKEADRAGIAEYLMKPLSVPVLNAAIRRALARDSAEAVA